MPICVSVSVRVQFQSGVYIPPGLRSPPPQQTLLKPFYPCFHEFLRRFNDVFALLFPLCILFFFPMALSFFINHRFSQKNVILLFGKYLPLESSVSVQFHFISVSVSDRYPFAFQFQCAFSFSQGYIYHQDSDPPAPTHTIEHSLSRLPPLLILF